MTEGTLLHKGPCDICGSSNARAVYDDGHSFCFACDPDDAWQAAPGSEGVAAEPREPRNRELIAGVLEPLRLRKIDQKTVEKFDYRVGQYHGRAVHIAPYHDASGRVVAQKLRFPDKDMKVLGDLKKALPLFGQSRWRDGGRMVVVTEGEIDAMSFAQAAGGTWPAVSIPNGAQGAAKAISAAIAWLEKFDKVVLMFDMDDVGQKAVVEAASVLTPGKAYIASLPLKDPNEMLQAGRSKELVDAAWAARQYRPDGLRSVAELKEKALAKPTYGLPYPWRTLTQRTRGITRPGLIGWGAGVGSGKTSLIKELILSAVRPDLVEDHTGLPVQDAKPRMVAPILFEEPPELTIRWLGGMLIGKRVHLPDVEYDEAELEAAIDSLDGWVWPYDHVGSKDYPAIEAHIKYMALAMGVTDFFIDPLTALVAHEDDERRALDGLMADLSGLVHAHNLTIHYVSHLTTPSGTPHEEGGRVMEKHFTGSRALARWSTDMFGLERDKQSPEEPTLIRGLKDRRAGDATGPLLALTYNRDTGRLVEVGLPDENGGFRDETAPRDF